MKSNKKLSKFTRPLRSCIKHVFSGSRRSTIPSGYLIYLARPNSDAYVTAEDALIPEDQYDWAYLLPGSLFATLGEGIFFEADGTPIAVLASEILADAGTNGSGYVLFKSINETQQTGRLVIYPPDTDAATLTRAKKVLRIET